MSHQEPSLVDLTIFAFRWKSSSAIAESGEALDDFPVRVLRIVEYKYDRIARYLRT